MHTKQRSFSELLLITYVFTYIKTHYCGRPSLWHKNTDLCFMQTWSSRDLSLGLETRFYKSWSWSWSWNLGVLVLVLGLPTMKTRYSSLMKR